MIFNMATGKLGNIKYKLKEATVNDRLTYAEFKKYMNSSIASSIESKINGLINTRKLLNKPDTIQEPYCKLAGYSLRYINEKIKSNSGIYDSQSINLYISDDTLLKLVNYIIIEKSTIYYKNLFHKLPELYLYALKRFSIDQLENQFLYVTDYLVNKINYYDMYNSWNSKFYGSKSYRVSYVELKKDNTALPRTKCPDHNNIIKVYFPMENNSTCDPNEFYYDLWKLYYIFLITDGTLDPKNINLNHINNIDSFIFGKDNLNCLNMANTKNPPIHKPLSERSVYSIIADEMNSTHQTSPDQMIYYIYRDLNQNKILKNYINNVDLFKSELKDAYTNQGYEHINNLNWHLNTITNLYIQIHDKSKATFMPSDCVKRIYEYTKSLDRQ